MNKAIFLDRDGTINEDRHYVHLKSDFAFLPQAPEAIKLLRSKGYLVIVVSNQSGVARGLFSIDDVESLNGFMRSELQRHGAEIDGIYYCPHLPDGTVSEYAQQCRCRKPGALLFERAISEYRINAEHSYAVGDKLRDLEPGKKLGMNTALISKEARTSNIVDAVYESLFGFASAIE